MTIEITILIVTILILCTFVFCFLYYIESKRLYNYMNTFESYNAVLVYHMEKAYNIVYKDKILIYSIEGTKPNESEIQSYNRDFCNLVIRLLGPRLQKEFSRLYGNDDTFLFIMTEYFNDKSENDEIRETSINNLMDQEIDEK